MRNKGFKENGIVLLDEQMPHERLHHVIECPSTYNDIIGKDEERHENALHTSYTPPPARGQLGKGTYRICMRMAAYEKLAEHDRHPYQHHTEQIYQNESSSAIVAHLGREAPHVAQPHSTTCRSKDYAQFATEILSVLHIMLFVC